MGRLIDIDDVRAALDSGHTLECNGRSIATAIYEDIIEKIPEAIIRCENCKYFSMTTLGMPYACWHRAEHICGETGAHVRETVCTRVDSPKHHCGYAKPIWDLEEGDNNGQYTSDNG